MATAEIESSTEVNDTKPEDSSTASFDKGGDRLKRKKNGSRRGGVKRRLSALAYHQMMVQRGAGGSAGRPLYPPGANPIHPRAAVRYPVLPPGRTGFPFRKFGFFSEATPSVHPGHPGSEFAKVPGPHSMPRPPPLFGPPFDLEPRREVLPTLPELHAIHMEAATSKKSAGINELFAKMVWKKLDMIQSATRLNRLHTEIMNILQQAIAEENVKQSPHQF